MTHGGPANAQLGANRRRSNQALHGGPEYGQPPFEPSWVPVGVTVDSVAFGC
jgi:hypothetical protein